MIYVLTYKATSLKVLYEKSNKNLLRMRWDQDRPAVVCDLHVLCERVECVHVGIFTLARNQKFNVFLFDFCNIKTLLF